MIKRNAAAYLQKLSEQYPVITITGPRQSGKTTLAKIYFRDLPYVSLENPDTLEFAESDTRGFLAQFKDGAIFDEVQRCPSIFSYLQQIVDSRSRNCRYVLTGSQQFGLRSHITQSLAGRAANVTLLPFGFGEWYNRRGVSHKSMEASLFTGLYPPVLDHGLDPSTWYANYVQNYIERDVRQLIHVHELRSFQLFVKMCASRSGTLLNLSNLSADCGISVNTAKAWLSVLEASYIVFLLQPYYNNFGKRLVKTPKLYFYDTGLLSYLLMIQSSAQLLTSTMRGQIFESYVVSEMKKNIYSTGKMDTLYFWRDRSGNEVDILYEESGKIHAIEVKSGQTVSSDFFKGLYKWKEIAGAQCGSLTVAYGGEDTQKRDVVKLVGWKKVCEIL